MNNEKTEKIQYKSVKTKLREVLRETWSIYKKNMPGFCALFILPIILSIALRFGLLAFIAKGGIPAGIAPNSISPANINWPVVIIGLIVVVVVGWLMQLYATNITLSGAFHADTEGKLELGKIFSEGYKKLGKAAGLSLRVFLYTGGWILLAVGAIWGIAMIMTIVGVNNPGVADALKPFAGVVALIPLVMLVVLIFLIRRFCEVVFAYPILMSKEVTSKEALNESVQLADGITGVIFGNYFLFGLLVALFTGITTQLFSQIVGLVYTAPATGSNQELLNYYENLSQIGSIIPAIISGSFSIVFQYAFMKKAIEEKTNQGGAPMMTVPTASPKTESNGPVIQ